MRTRCAVHCPQGFHAGGFACPVRAATVCGSVIVPLLVYRALFQAHLWLLAERPKLQHWGAVCPCATACRSAARARLPVPSGRRLALRRAPMRCAANVRQLRSSEHISANDHTNKQTLEAAARTPHCCELT